MKLLSASWDELKDPFGLFDSVTYVNTPTDVKDGVLILWGGEDIGTSLYNQKPNRFCYSAKTSPRDDREAALVSAALANNVPIIGICRGAQLLCALAGGTLAQHIEGHGRSHTVYLHDEDNIEIMCNSSHHQMMLPPSSAKILASGRGVAAVLEDNKAEMLEQANEVVYFPSLNALGIQPHPEWDNCPTEFVDYCVRKIKEYLL